MERRKLNFALLPLATNDSQEQRKEIPRVLGKKEIALQFPGIEKVFFYVSVQKKGCL